MASKEKTFNEAFMTPLTGGENPILTLMLGLCPTMAVTTSLKNGFAMGLGVIWVLFSSNLMVSLVRNVIPKDIRIPAFITIIATNVTVVELVMAAVTPEIHEAMGIFLALIVVNCIILGRAEGFASKNGVMPAIGDGLGMGVGFALTLCVLGGIRELLGAGSLWDVPVSAWPGIGGLATSLNGMVGFENSLVFVLPPGGFLILGLMMAATRLQKRMRGDG